MTKNIGIIQYILQKIGMDLLFFVLLWSYDKVIWAILKYNSYFKVPLQVNGIVIHNAFIGFGHITDSSELHFCEPK